MTPLLWRSGWRYHRRHPWQLLLAVIGILLGVAVVTAIDITNESARRAFSLSVETLTGKATHRIVGNPVGFEQQFYVSLRNDGIRPSAPIIDGIAHWRGRSLRLLGIDPFADADFRAYRADNGDTEVLTNLLRKPNHVFISEVLAAQHGLQHGDKLTLTLGGRKVTVTIAGLMREQRVGNQQALQDVLVTDIATAQELLELGNRISHIDLIVDDDKTLQNIEQRLPEGLRIEPAGRRQQTMAAMINAFSINLTALSLLALLVGMFLIYNTMTFSVLQRRPYIGNLRGLGVNRRELFMLIGLEALVLGMVGTLLGIGVGVLLAKGLIGLVAQTINDLYFVIQISHITLTPFLVIKATALGIGATLVATAIPAWQATRVPPRLVMLRSDQERRHQQQRTPLLVAGVALLAGGYALLQWGMQDLLSGFTAIFLIITGFALLVPILVTLCVGLLNRLSKGWTPLTLRLALRGVSASLSRTGVAIAALTIAISVSIGMDTMVSSFRSTVVAWLERSLQADIYISPPEAVHDRYSTPISSESINYLKDLSGIEYLSTYREIEVESELGVVQLQALKMAPPSLGGYHFKQGDAETVWPAFFSDSIIISEPLAYRHQLTVGDTLTLQTDRGRVVFPIVGIFYDYESDRGIVEMAREVYERYYDDRAVTGIGLYLQSPQQTNTLLQRLYRELPQVDSLRLRSSAQLRQYSLVVFDRTFAITDVLRLLAIAVAFTGVVGALLALQLEKSREYAVLRATGLTPAGLSTMILIQTGVMGILAGMLAIPLGIVLAEVLIEVINRRAFGWTLWLTIPPQALWQGVTYALVAALLAGIYPAWRMGRANLASALKEE